MLWAQTNPSRHSTYISKTSFDYAIFNIVLLFFYVTSFYTATNENVEFELSRLSFNDPTTKAESNMLCNQLITCLKDRAGSSQQHFIIFDSALDFVWEKLHTGHWCLVADSWRKLFTLISILKARTLIDFSHDSEKKQ